jgi:homoserine O-acetyltransferase
MIRPLTTLLLTLALAFTADAALAQPAAPAASGPEATDGDFVIPNFRFHTGETLPALRMHYTTVGAPIRDAHGQVTNAVLIMHGTGGWGRVLIRPEFSGVLFSPGGLLEARRYFIILPDDIGHGKSSKPSDGLRAHFPRYDYDDMVEAEHRLVTDGLHVDHLRLVMGTSMGCMHAFLWGERYPDAMDALMPLACLPVPIAGRNRLWRAMVVDAITSDPAWKGGDYVEEPRQALRTAEDLLLIAGSAPLVMQKTLPSREAAEAYLDKRLGDFVKTEDANDVLYYTDSSRDYDAGQHLEAIKAPVMWINSADDFINPPELGIAEQQVKRIKNGRFVLIPIGPETRGHGTHTMAAVWKDYLAELLKETER